MLTPGIPLDWEQHLRQLNHNGCSKDDYPDLSMDIKDRLRLRSIRRMEKYAEENGLEAL